MEPPGGQAGSGVVVGVLPQPPVLLVESSGIESSGIASSLLESSVLESSVVIGIV